MVDVVGVVVLVALYIAVLVVGVVAAHWFKRRHNEAGETQVALVAGRKLGGVVGIFTMTGRYSTNLSLVSAVWAKLYVD